MMKPAYNAKATALAVAILALAWVNVMVGLIRFVGH